MCARIATFYPGTFRHVLLVCCLAAVALLPVAEGLCASQSVSQILRLQYRDRVTYSGEAIPSTFHRIKIRKHPFGRKPILFGGVKFGSATDIYGYAWDKKNGVLYLDLNHNSDVTDDPDGVLSGGGGTGTQSFSFLMKIRPVPFPIPYRICITFPEGSETPNLSVISGWQSKVELYGKTWRVSLIDQLNGEITPDDAMYLEPVEQSTGMPKALATPERLPPCKLLFLDGHLYSMRYSIEANNSRIEAVIRMDEKKTKTGELRLPGGMIRRLILEDPDKSLVAVYDSPRKSITVPAGSYSRINVTLENGFMLKDVNSSAITMDVDGKPVLRAGAPLDNSVSVATKGNVLSLQYYVRGMGGEIYSGAGDDKQSVPGYSIYRGKRKIASGYFEDNGENSWETVWKAPVTAMGNLAIVSSRDLGSFGPKDGQPVECRLSPLHCLIAILPWVMLLLFLLLGDNHDAQVLLLLIPLLLVKIGFSVLDRYSLIPSDVMLKLGEVIVMTIVGITAFCLLSHTIFSRHRVSRFITAASVMLAMGIFATLSGSAFRISEDFPRHVTLYIIGVISLVGGMYLSGIIFLRRSRLLFLVGLGLCMMGIASAGLIGVYWIMDIAQQGFRGPPIITRQVIMPGMVLGIVFYIITLPFMLLMLTCRLFRARLTRLLETSRPREPAMLARPAAVKHEPEQVRQPPSERPRRAGTVQAVMEPFSPPPQPPPAPESIRMPTVPSIPISMPEQREREVEYAEESSSDMD